MTALEVAAFLAEALETVYLGSIRVATDKRSYATFSKKDELVTEHINMEWASRAETRTPTMRRSPVACAVRVLVRRP